MLLSYLVLVVSTSVAKPSCTGHNRSQNQSNNVVIFSNGMAIQEAVTTTMDGNEALDGSTQTGLVVDPESLRILMEAGVLSPPRGA